MRLIIILLRSSTSFAFAFFLVFQNVLALFVIIFGGGRETHPYYFAFAVAVAVAVAGYGGSSRRWIFSVGRCCPRPRPRLFFTSLALACLLRCSSFTFQRCCLWCLQPREVGFGGVASFSASQPPPSPWQIRMERVNRSHEDR